MSVCVDLVSVCDRVEISYTVQYSTYSFVLIVPVSIRGISDDPNGSLVSNVVAMAAPRRAAAMCESGESQFFIVRSTISSESGFPATQSNRTHSQITQLVESHDWGEHAGKSWTTLEGYGGFYV